MSDKIKVNTGIHTSGHCRSSLSYELSMKWLLEKKSHKTKQKK